MQFNAILELAATSAALLGIAYRVGRTEAKIFEKIDETADYLDVKIQQIDKELTAHRSRADERYETTRAIIHQMNQKIDHKFQRLHNGQKQVQRYLQEHHSFIVEGEEY